MFTWNAASMLDTVPLTWTSMPSREPPTTWKSVCRGEAEYGFVVIGGGSEAGGEFRGREELAVVRTLRVIDVGEERLESSRIAQGQDQVELQHLVAGESAIGLRLAAAHHITNMMRHDRLGQAGCCGEQQRCEDGQEFPWF